MDLGVIGLAALAGVLSALSPCVLPLLPLVLSAAASEHKWGPALLALGVAVAFLAVGLFVATIGYSIGLDSDKFRYAAAALMAIAGVLLLAPPLQDRLSAAAGPLSDRLDRAFRGAPVIVALGPLGMGLTLGAVWSPCVGPTLGAASVLAARGENLREVALVMGAFGVGAAAPLLALGLLSRQLLTRWRGGLLGAGKRAKQALGALLLALGLLILTNLDRPVEAAALDLSPAWLTRLTTRF
jgi:cytochrome c-type biogenesis protein